MAGIGEAADRSGVMIETIRYYEREGVVPKPSRTSSGRRTYSDQDIGRLRFVKRCRDLGFAISEAKALLNLTDGSLANCSVARTIAENQLSEVRAKIMHLKRMESALSRMISQCDVSGKDCPILAELLSD